MNIEVKNIYLQSIQNKSYTIMIGKVASVHGFSPYIGVCNDGIGVDVMLGSLVMILPLRKAGFNAPKFGSTLM